MITVFSLLLSRCGLSHREAAAMLAVRLDTVKSWSAGRNRAPAGVIDALRHLRARQMRAVSAALDLAQAHCAAEILEIGHASDDHEAQALGWPCVGAHLAVVGEVAAVIERPVTVVPRGSTSVVVGSHSPIG